MSEVPIIRVEWEHPDRQAIRRIAQQFREGRILIYPTDTVYGLGCDPFHPGALERLGKIKDRQQGKSYIWLIGSSEWVGNLAGELPDIYFRLAEKFWPGPLTLILKASTRIPGELTGPNHTIALRWAGCAFLENLFGCMNGPIVSTSANSTGQEVMKDPLQSDSPLLHLVDGIVSAGLLPGQPSTIVDLTNPVPGIVREGCLKSELLLPFFSMKPGRSA